MFLGIPFWNGVNLVCVSSSTFIFSWCNDMDKPHSLYIVNVQAMTIESFYAIKTPPSPILLDLV